MTIRTDTAHITPAGGNVFADLGFDHQEAAALKAESQRIIAEKLAIKVAMMAEISKWIKAEKLKQDEAARILGVTRPRVSDVVNNKNQKFTIDALLDMLFKAHLRPQFTIAH
jgi:predicted XRE-type DNA-binding protein